MKRLSNYILFVGLIMATVSMAVALVYRFTPMELAAPEKSNLIAMYFIGAAMSIVSAGYKLFKESSK